MLCLYVYYYTYIARYLLILLTDIYFNLSFVMATCSNHKNTDMLLALSFHNTFSLSHLSLFLSVEVIY